MHQRGGMTKTQWQKILTDLRTMRTTNKFGKFNRIFYDYSTPKKIEMINTEYSYLLLENREVIKHKDVSDITPSEFRSRFYVTLPVFTINTIQF